VTDSTRLTPAGWIFLSASWGAILWLTVWCIYRLTKSSR
jgi:hypothetical protein